MVRIRLKRLGRKNKVFYRIIVADSHRARDGRFIETLGWYDPVNIDKNIKFQLNPERALHWLTVGAQPTETVRALLRKAGVLKAFHLSRKPAAAA